MDNRSKALLWVAGIIVIVSIGFTYYRIIVRRDYIIEAQTDCDPYTERCFHFQCDQNSTKEGLACTGTPENDDWYYQVVRRKAANIPDCDPARDENCQALECPSDEKDCEVRYCEDGDLPEGVTCNDPVVYAAENPVVEEEPSPCDPDSDEGCADTEAGVGGEPETVTSESPSEAIQ